jgi:hypothetical protein
VVSQCHSSYFYSEKDAEAVERAFASSEGMYCQCVDKIRQGKELSGREYGRLLMIMFDFYLRNVVHENETAAEGIEAYRRRARLFLHSILLGRNSGQSTEQEVVDHIQTNWGLSVISCLEGRAFLSSDHPSVFITFNKPRHRLDLVSLPLTPTHMAIGFDRRVCEVRDVPLPFEDYRTLLCGQIANGASCVYSCCEFLDADKPILEEQWSHRSGEQGRITESDWFTKVHYIPPEHRFSFLRMVPPRY